MKIKSDFVTNSSSTSFIITFRAGAGGKEDFVKKFNDLLRVYIEKRSWDEEFREPPFLTGDIVEQVGDKYTIRDFVPIYCGEGDIPQYIQDILQGDSEISKLFIDAGIQLIKMETKDLND